MYISFQIFLYNGHGGDSVNCMVTYQYINPLNFFFNQKYLFLLIFFPLPAENIIVKTMDGCTPNTTDNARYAEAGLVKEGCIQHRSLYKPPSSEYCYCSHNLCNGTMTNLSSTVILAILLATALFYNYQWSSLSWYFQTHRYYKMIHLLRSPFHNLQLHAHNICVVQIFYYE